MKKTTSVAAVALSVFTAVMLVSVVSAYDSAYGFTIFSSEPSIIFTNDGVVLNESVSGINSGMMPVRVSVLNESFIVQPGNKIMRSIFMPLNLTDLLSNGYPLHNVTIPLSLMAFITALFFNASKSIILGGKNIPAPFSNFSVDNVTQTSFGKAIIEVSFYYFLPEMFHIANILLKYHNTTLGQISLKNLTRGLNILSGTLSTGNSSIPAEITFVAGPLSWSVPLQSKDM